jgi:hypothetical protein
MRDPLVDLDAPGAHGNSQQRWDQPCAGKFVSKSKTGHCQLGHKGLKQASVRRVPYGFTSMSQTSQRIWTVLGVNDLEAIGDVVDRRYLLAFRQRQTDDADLAAPRTFDFFGPLIVHGQLSLDESLSRMEAIVGPAAHTGTWPLRTPKRDQRKNQKGPVT